MGRHPGNARAEEPNAGGRAPFSIIGNSMKGRKPLPTEYKRLTGNPGRRPLNNREPNPAQLSSLDIPEELGRDAIAIAEWQRLAPMLHTCKQVTEADKTSLICLCWEWSRYLKARRKSAGAP